MRVDVGARINPAKGFQDLFSAPHSDQPVMDDCHAHEAPEDREITPNCPNIVAIWPAI